MLTTSVVVTALLYLAGEGVFNFRLKHRGFNFEDGYRQTIVHFGTWALVTAGVLFWLFPSFGVAYGLLVIVLVLSLYAAWFEHRLNQFLAAKAVEVIFQQGIVALILLSAHSAGLTLGGATLLFAVVFTGLHLPLLYLLPGSHGWIYVCGALAAAFVFPVLLWRYPSGIFLTYLLHYGFYAVMYFAFYRHREYPT